MNNLHPIFRSILASHLQVVGMDTKNPKIGAPSKAIGTVRTAIASTRICPCGCGKLARPGDPGYGQRLTIFGKSGYWRKACIKRLRAIPAQEIGR
jgi:hypothetical protein